jgi:hypothetical protein
MARSSSNVGLLLLAVGMALLLNPSCQAGCRTFAQHLVTHGLRRI